MFAGSVSHRISKGIGKKMLMEEVSGHVVQYFSADTSAAGWKSPHCPGERDKELFPK